MSDLAQLRAAAEQVEARLEEISGRVADVISQRLPVGQVADALEGPLREVVVARAGLQGILARHDVLMRPSAAVPEPRSAAEIRAESDTKRYFADVRHRYLRWRQINEAIGFYTGWQGAPLYPAPPPRTDMVLQQRRATDAAFLALHRFVNPMSQDAAADELGCFPDIPMAPMDFTGHAHAAMRVAQARHGLRDLRFLDVGCGGGIKVLQAAQLFAVADGLEYDPGYVAAARAMLGQVGAGHCRVFEADALTFADYGSYDVIYFYQPMRETELLHRLEDHIIATARPGTVLIAPYARFQNRIDILDCEPIAGAVHVTGIGPQEADALRASAEGLAGAVAPFPAEPDQRAGYLRPLLAAFAANGYPL